MEYQYLKRVPSFLAAGKTPMKCSALSTSVFIDPTGNVYPCTIYDKKVGNIKERSLRTIWADYETKVLAEEIRGFHCPQCWTPCEAYQTIIANRFGLL
jgi:radical SAM protein with 4Fe4S-binding SPASM domain